MTNTIFGVNPKVVTNVENYHAKEVTTSFTLLTGNVPVAKLKKKHAEKYREDIVDANINVPDDYFMQWYGYDGWSYLESED